MTTDDHQIVVGDALREMRGVPDASCGLVFIDPPYNIGKRFGDFEDKWDTDDDYIQWCEEWMDLCIQKLTPTGTMYLMGSTQSMPFLDIALRDRLTILSRIVWHYDSSGVQARTRFGSMYEPILHAVVNPKNYCFNASDILVDAPTGSRRHLMDYRKNPPATYATTKVPGNVWYIPRVRFKMPEYQNHPTQKPEALMERIVLASSNQGDVVLDPFAGVLTTAAVAKRLGRRSISIERNPDYVDAGRGRLDEYAEITSKDIQ